MPVNKHPPRLASIGLIITGNMTQECGAVIERQRAKAFISSTSSDTMAFAVHEATIVSSQMSNPSLCLSVLLLCTCPTTNAPHCAVQPFRTDHYSKPRSLRISYSRLGGLVEADRVPSHAFEVLCLGGGAEGRGGGEYSHTYSWRGGLRAACYVWMMKSSQRPPPKLIRSHFGISRWAYFVPFDIHYGSDPIGILHPKLVGLDRYWSKTCEDRRFHALQPFHKG